MKKLLFFIIALATYSNSAEKSSNEELHKQITANDSEYQLYKNFLSECRNIPIGLKIIFNSANNEIQSELETYAARISALELLSENDKRLKEAFDVFKKENQEIFNKFKELYRGKISI